VFIFQLSSLRWRKEEFSLLSDPAVAASAATKRPLSQLGSFVLGPRVIDAQQRLGNVVLVAVTGLTTTEHAGVAGFAYCTALGELSAAQMEQATALLDRIKLLTGPTFVPVLEAGIVGRVGYVAEAALPGERLSDRLARDRRFQPWRVAQIVSDVAVALDAAHRQQVSHGQIDPMVIWIDDGRSARLGGFGLAGRGPSRDQEMLAALSFELLSGHPWNFGDGSSAFDGALVDRVRGQVQGLTERTATVIARGLERDPANRYSSALEFGNALRQAVEASAVDVAAGAWEAISRGDSGMAAILTEMTSGYDPSSTELPLLRLRLDKQAMSNPSALAATLIEPISLTPQPIREIAIEPKATIDAPEMPSGTPFDETELRRLFVPADGAPDKPKGNPWVVFLTVVFGMILLLTVLAAVMFARS
jgi:hypothetical protein